VTGFEFVKSSYSAASGECAEVATNVPAVVAIRDSKNTSGSCLRLPTASWAAFLAGIRAPGA
jgi:hypothetical protein